MCVCVCGRFLNCYFMLGNKSYCPMKDIFIKYIFTWFPDRKKKIKHWSVTFFCGFIWNCLSHLKHKALLNAPPALTPTHNAERERENIIYYVVPKGLLCFLHSLPNILSLLSFFFFLLGWRNSDFEWQYW